MVASQNSHAVLRAILGVLSALVGLGGLVLIFATSWLLGLVLHNPSAQEAAWIVVVFKALGAVVLFVAYALYNASRDPVRYAAVVDGMIALLVVLSILDIYAVAVLGFGTYYPAWAVYARAGLRLLLAVVLLTLRPRPAAG